MTLDDGTAVVDDAEVAIMPGERVLIAGESGTGKSTLVRAIAGLWPWGGGAIEVASRRQAVPAAAAALRSGRHAAARGDLSGRRRRPGRRARSPRPASRSGSAISTTSSTRDAPWDQTLSGGEKQRLAFARILLHRPDIVVLDEATSALDPDEPGQADGAADRASSTRRTIVSVGHRPELEAFHSRKIMLEPPRCCWQRGEQDFLGNRYSRRHLIRFDGGAEVAGSSSPHVVPLPFSDPAGVDPEEAFVASLSSCHMLWFLSLAAKAGWQVETYADNASGTMARNSDGRMAMTVVTLRPARDVLRRTPARRRGVAAPAPQGARRLLHRQLGENRGALRASSIVVGRPSRIPRHIHSTH